MVWRQECNGVAGEKRAAALPWKGADAPSSSLHLILKLCCPCQAPQLPSRSCGEGGGQGRGPGNYPAAVVVPGSSHAPRSGLCHHAMTHICWQLPILPLPAESCSAIVGPGMGWIPVSRDVQAAGSPGTSRKGEPHITASVATLRLIGVAG